MYSSNYSWVKEEQNGQRFLGINNFSSVMLLASFNTFVTLPFLSKTGV
jgi:hypothetical protein